MARTISEYAGSRDNNFNLIRLVAAWLVLFSHSFALVTGSVDREPLRSLLGMTPADIAVDVFFVTSGFLIAWSFYARNSLLAFVWARVLRIFPALFIAVLFCVFVVGLTYTSRSSSEYLTDPMTVKFLIKNSILFDGILYQLPGVFDGNPAHAVNGSLWTLPYECKMYAYLAVIAVSLSFVTSRAKIRLWIYTTLAIGSLAVYFFDHFKPLPGLRPQSTRLFAMFFVGVGIYALREKIVLHTKVFWAGVAVLAVAWVHQGAFFIVYNLLMPYMLFYLAYVPGGPIREYNRLGDYSYGLYIYAYPLQQCVVASVSDASIGQVIVYSTAITLVAAYLSWHLVEKRCLKLKDVYRILSGRASAVKLPKHGTTDRTS